jgi:hypothetical protein
MRTAKQYPEDAVKQQINVKKEKEEDCSVPEADSELARPNPCLYLQQCFNPIYNQSLFFHLTLFSTSSTGLNL